MGHQSSPEEKELYKRIDEVLHYIWDPIGVAGEPYARDEYYTYLPKVYAMLLQANPDRQDIIDYLMQVCGEFMGLTKDPKETEAVVDILMAWENKIFKQIH